jgi:branched-chain amino acid transport system substrate-binding protein
LGNEGRHIFSILLALVLLYSAGCSIEDEAIGNRFGVSPDSIIIGSSSALSGHAGFLGSQYRIGSEALFRQINEKGGIHGRFINLISYDDQYDPPKTKENTVKLIDDDQVFMLFNYVGTPTSVQIIETVHNNRIPSFGFLTGAETLRTPFRPYMFHLRGSYYAEAEAAVKYFVDDLGLQDLAVMYQDDAFGLAVLAGVQMAMRRRARELIGTGTYTRGTMDVERAAEHIQQSDPQAVIMVGTYSPLAKFIEVSHQANFFPKFHTVSFIGSDAFGGEIMSRDIRTSEYHNIVVTQVVPSPYDPVLEGIQEYHLLLAKHFPDEHPNYVSLEGFLNAKLLAEAFRRVGPDLTRNRLGQTLESMVEVDLGVGSSVSFGALDHTGLNQVFLSRLMEDGSFRVFSAGE